jgi:predicted aspartyl protease
VPATTVLQNQGPIIQIMLTQPQSVMDKLIGSKEIDPNKIQILRINALIDTGAFSSAITPKVAATLKLIQTGTQKVTSVNNEEEQPVYFAKLIFPWGRHKEVQVISCPLKGNFDCLIGRDILQHWLITYNGIDGTITICD